MKHNNDACFITTTRVYNDAVSALRILVTIVLSAAVSHAAADSVTFPRSTMPVLSFPASVSAGRDTAVGTLISNQVTVPGLVANTTCTTTKNVTVTGTLVPGFSNVYQSGVPGVGVRFNITGSWNSTFVAVPISESLPPISINTQYYTRADLVVTGPIGSGSITNWPSMNVSFSGPCISTTMATQPVTGTTIITGNTCSVSTPALEFNLPKAFAKDLLTAGATTGDTTVPLVLDCPAGVKVAITITDSVNSANRSTALALAPESSASGLGIQILNGSTAIAFGPDSAVAGTVNQWTAGAAAGGQMQIPLTARYVRAAGTLIPGSVKAKATFTMSYQ
ncbi:type-1 fimbrial protein subunit A [Caballeronia cordobensis]|uniref:Type-1 fimbrial protein subunit A n=1 Tax=Caballeronia cordobensis TaxID=1353886 RepID=A0A158HBR3_CABCO|nr:fimbrial protein [Caballeronia cordobensis]SAL41150.1 type-1 fimbrial protein subunit A [Caballeronia cordobensis]